MRGSILRHAWLLLALYACPAGAEERGGFELGVAYGISFLEVEHRPPMTPEWMEGSDRLTGGFVQGITFGRRLGDRVLAELSFAIGPGHERTSEGPVYCATRGIDCAPACVGDPESPECIVPFPPFDFWQERVVSYEYGASFAIDLAAGDLRPFFSLGVGGVSYALQDWTESDVRYSFGVGIRRYFDRVGARLEVVDFVSSDSFVSGKVEHDVQVRAGLQVRLP